MKMIQKKKCKNNTKILIRNASIFILKPFLPFIIIIMIFFCSICSIIDAIFIQEVQRDSYDMPQEQQELRAKCIEIAEYLNTCHNYEDNRLTNYLLDIDNRENDKKIEWSHLYAIIAFNNMTNNDEINEFLIDEVAKEFESTFKYEKVNIKTETTIIDNKGKETTDVKEETVYILVESDTIMGHYKYNYEERTINNDNKTITKKVFTNEELIGEKYERLKNYLKEKLKISDDDIDTDVQIIIEASNGYYDGEENTEWLQGNSSSDTIITDGKG